MADLLTLEQAKAHLGVPAALTDNDTDIRLKVSQASETVLDHLKSRADPAWTSDNLPPRVQAAVQLFLTHFYENRGENMEADEQVWEAVKRLLAPYRDPAYA